MSWLPEMDIAREGPDAASARVRVEPDWPWFDGHFPGRPLLPGLGMLALVSALAGRAFGPGPWRVRRIDKCRFKGLVRPGEQLEIAVFAGTIEAERLPVRFELLREGEPVGAGRLQLGRPAAGQSGAAESEFV